MESPPSSSAHSEAPLLSEDSGLTVTSRSVSSDSVSGCPHISSELQESDYDDKSLSLYDAHDTSELMCGDNFNTVKKGPLKLAIDPPPEFQDSPKYHRSNTGKDISVESNSNEVISVDSISTCLSHTLLTESSAGTTISCDTDSKCLICAKCLVDSKAELDDDAEGACAISLQSGSQSPFSNEGQSMRRNSVTENENFMISNEEYALNCCDNNCCFSDSLVKRFSCPYSMDLSNLTPTERRYTHFPLVSKLLASQPLALPDIDKEGSELSVGINEGFSTCRKTCCTKSRYSCSRMKHLSPSHMTTRPASRSSLTSRLSSSHNSLMTQLQADDSSFITQAISHGTLSTRTSDIDDMYNVPFDSDIYTVPIDSIQPVRRSRSRNRRGPQNNFGRKPKSYNPTIVIPFPERLSVVTKGRAREPEPSQEENKRHSLPGTSSTKQHPTVGEVNLQEPIHMPFGEVKRFLNTFHSSQSESEDGHTTMKEKCKKKPRMTHNRNLKFNSLEGKLDFITKKNETENLGEINKPKRTLLMKETKKHKEPSTSKDPTDSERVESKQIRSKKSPVKNFSNLKQTLYNLFRMRKINPSDSEGEDLKNVEARREDGAVARRALPPIPSTLKQTIDQERANNFAESLRRVKDYGWYWGPITVEASEKLLSDEPDGSFIVRDSSDDHYIFTLSFKLNGIRHVRIEHEEGSFCFGSSTMFKAPTIVEFIEKAVEISRSGRYIFFLNLRPGLGPVRVQLLFPVSRFKRVQSLQHMCRFVILKEVRRDLINSLPLPRRMLDYLNTKDYYSEYNFDS